MGYNVSVSGTVWLTEEDEARLVPLLRQDMLGADGWLDRDEPVTTLNDLATFAAASCSRQGDQVHFSDDEEGDPKWSEQATAFYLGLARVAIRGEIRVQGEDDETWRYTDKPDGPAQHGRNGWDGSGSDDDQEEPDGHVADALGPVDSLATPGLRERVRRYTIFGAVPVAGGGLMLAAGNDTGALPLALGAVNLVVAGRLRRRLNEESVAP